MNGKSFLLKIDYLGYKDAYTGYNKLDNLNKNEDEGTADAKTVIPRYCVTTGCSKEASNDGGVRFQASIEENILIIECFSSELDLEIHVKNVVEHLYDNTVSSLYILEHDHDLKNYVVWQSVTVGFVEVYNTADVSTYVENFNEFFDVGSYEEALDAIVKIFKEGRIKDRSQLKRLFDMCKDENLNFVSFCNIHLGEMDHVDVLSPEGELLLNCALKSKHWKRLTSALFNFSGYLPDPYLKDAKGKSAFDIANERGLQDAVLKMLPSDEVDFSILIGEILYDDGRMVQDYLDLGDDPNEMRNGYTPIMIAALKGPLEVAKRLLEGGADVNAFSSAGWSALMFASCAGDNEMVQLLLDNGADPTPEDKYGWTALKIATERNHTDAAELLGKSFGKSS